FANDPKPFAKHPESLTNDSESFAKHPESLTNDSESFAKHPESLTNDSESFAKHPESLTNDSFWRKAGVSRLGVLTSRRNGPSRLANNLGSRHRGVRRAYRRSLRRIRWENVVQLPKGG